MPSAHRLVAFDDTECLALTYADAGSTGSTGNDGPTPSCPLTVVTRHEVTKDRFHK